MVAEKESEKGPGKMPPQEIPAATVAAVAAGIDGEDAVTASSRHL